MALSLNCQSDIKTVHVMNATTQLSQHNCMTLCIILSVTLYRQTQRTVAVAVTQTRKSSHGWSCDNLVLTSFGLGHIL